MAYEYCMWLNMALATGAINRNEYVKAYMTTQQIDRQTKAYSNTLGSFYVYRGRIAQYIGGGVLQWYEGDERREMRASSLREFRIKIELLENQKERVKSENGQRNCRSRSNKRHKKNY